MPQRKPDQVPGRIQRCLGGFQWRELGKAAKESGSNDDCLAFWTECCCVQYITNVHRVRSAPSTAAEDTTQTLGTDGKSGRCEGAVNFENGIRASLESAAVFTAAFRNGRRWEMRNKAGWEGGGDGGRRGMLVKAVEGSNLSPDAASNPRSLSRSGNVRFDQFCVVSTSDHIPSYWTTQSPGGTVWL